MKRIATGVKGFDELIEGGIPEGASVLLAGGPGTGKTIFATQFLYQGAIKFNDPGLYVTLETNLRNITWDMENFSWDIKKLQEKELFKIYKLNLSGRKQEDVEDQVYEELKVISDIVEKFGAKRLVIDSTTAFGVWIREQGAMRNLLFEFSDYLKKLDCLTIFTSETAGGKMDFSAFGIEEFIADSVVAFYLSPPHRSIFIRKMRGTNHSMSPHPFQITPQGIVVQPREDVMWESIK